MIEPNGTQWTRELIIDAIDELEERGLVEQAGLLDGEPTYRLTAKAHVRERGDLDQLPDAADRLLAKFHRETDCGEDGMHWSECQRLLDVLGFDCYEEWERQRA